MEGGSSWYRCGGRWIINLFIVGMLLKYMDLLSRFWDKVEIQDGGCWKWLGATNNQGYGEFSINHKMVRAHRFSYQIHESTIPEGLVIDHKCRNVWCVNPKHLEPVTNKENLNRGRSANREKTHCMKGHEYNQINTYYHNNNRHCRTCKLDNTRKYRNN